MKDDIQKLKDFKKWFGGFVKREYGAKCRDFTWGCAACHANFVKDLFDDFVDDHIATEEWAIKGEKARGKKILMPNDNGCRLLKMKNQKMGGGLIAIAGPVSNFTVAGVFSLLINYSYKLPFLTPDFLNIATMIVIVNVSLACFNLVPIPPLDGSKVLFGVLPRSLGGIEGTLERYGFLILIMFIMFFSSSIIPIINAVLRFFL